MEFQKVEKQEFDKMISIDEVRPIGWASIGVSEIYETSDGERQFYYFVDEEEVYEVME